MNTLLIIGGLVIIAYTVFRLIREQLRLRKAIGQTKEKMQDMEKLASLGQLSAIIAHEIKNSLNYVINFSEGAKEVFDELREDLDEYQSSRKPEVLQRLLETVNDLQQNNQSILSNGHRVGKIISNVMDHSHGVKAVKQEVRFNQLIEEQVKAACAAYQPAATDHMILLDQQYDPSIPTLLLDPEDVARIFLNLISNACHAVDQKAVELGEGYAPEIYIQTELKGSEVEVRIRDNGPGIPQELIHQIFKPFFTTKPSGKGNSGLGLALCEKIVAERLNGKIQVQSKHGEFTEFVVRLQIQQA
ncbi:MAG: ATP-binding protein [Bacteroidota bacterium]